MGEEGGELRVRARDLELDRGAEVPEQREAGRRIDALELESLDRTPDLEHEGAVVSDRRGGGAGFGAEHPSLPVQEAERERDVHGLCARAGRDFRNPLLHPQLESAPLRIVFAVDAQDRGARLGVPAAELTEVGTRRVLHRGHEVVGGDRLTVVAREVEVHPLPEPARTEQGVHHADDFGALEVHRRGVEVVDGLVRARAHGVGVGAGILLELVVADEARVADALDRGRAHRGRELLVPEHGQTLLQAELEPVAAGHPVAGPVVEVLVADDRLDVRVVGIGGALGIGEDVAGVEDVEALVLHRPHVEVVHRHDHEEVEVVLEPVLLLVPAHRLLERGHRVPAAPDVVGLRVDAQRNVAARPGGVRALQAGEVACDQGEQVGRFGEGIFPAYPVPAVLRLAARDRIAVGEQHREVGAVGTERGGEAREHVRPIGVEGDAPEVLRLALGAEDAVRCVEPLVPGVALREDPRPYSQREGSAGAGRPLAAALPVEEGGGKDESAVLVEAVLVRGERAAFEGHLHELQLGAVEDEWRVGRRVGCAPQRQRRGDERFRRPELDVEVHPVHQEGRRPVVLEPDLARGAGRG